MNIYAHETPRRAVLLAGLILLGAAGGCSTIDRAQRYDMLEIENMNLRRRLAKLEAAKDTEISHLEAAKRQLEERLKDQISGDQARLEMTDRGLVITFLAEVFFDSGKAEIRESGMSSLGNVADVLKSELPGSPLAIEGHTDNVPIKHSGWNSNWELSTARALSVLHYLIDEGGIAPDRLSIVGYGEHQPVADNKTAAGRQQNRRVEIVVLPAEAG